MHGDMKDEHIYMIESNKKRTKKVGFFWFVDEKW